LPLHPPGATDGGVLRPAEGAHAARAVAARHRRAQGRLRPRHQPGLHPQQHDHAAHDGADDRVDGAAGRPDRTLARLLTGGTCGSPWWARPTRTRAGAPGTPPNWPTGWPPPDTAWSSSRGGPSIRRRCTRAARPWPNRRGRSTRTPAATSPGTGPTAGTGWAVGPAARPTWSRWPSSLPCRCPPTWGCAPDAGARHGWSRSATTCCRTSGGAVTPR